MFCIFVNTWIVRRTSRLPLDQKLFERDLQAALQLSKESIDKATVPRMNTNFIDLLAVNFVSQFCGSAQFCIGFSINTYCSLWTELLSITRQKHVDISNEMTGA